MKHTIFIFHGTEGHPQENWFPWLKARLEEKGHQVLVPQFPTPPIVPAQIDEWFEVLKLYESSLTEATLLVGHSLGGIFTLRILEKLTHPVQATFFIGTPVGVQPIKNYDRDSSFSGFDFNWQKIKANAGSSTVFQSDDDPYVGLKNGEKLAEELGVQLSFVPNAGHFNAKAGYTEFPVLLDKILLEIEEG